jgi:Flp pilus assembly pilin Flp
MTVGRVVHFYRAARARQMGEPAPRRSRFGWFRIGELILAAWQDDAGGEVLEYSIVAGLIVVASISVVTCVGTKIVARWTSLRNSI